MMPKLFGEYLSEFYRKAKQKDKSYSQQRIADEIGVNMRTFYSWIRGRKVPRDRTIVPKIAQFFSNLLGKEVTVDELNASIEAQIAKAKKIKGRGKGKEKIEVEKVPVAKTKQAQVKTTPTPMPVTLDHVIDELIQIRDYAKKSPAQLQKDEEELLETYRKLSSQAKRDIFAYCRFRSK